MNIKGTITAKATLAFLMPATYFPWLTPVVWKEDWKPWFRWSPIRQTIHNKWLRAKDISFGEPTLDRTDLHQQE